MPKVCCVSEHLKALHALFVVKGSAQSAFHSTIRAIEGKLVVVKLEDRLVAVYECAVPLHEGHAYLSSRLQAC